MPRRRSPSRGPLGNSPLTNSLVVLGADNVTGLQFFLMDAAKRYVAVIDAFDEWDELFASAAALDYALLLSSEHADEVIDDAAPVATTMRETMTRAAVVALRFTHRMLEAPRAVFTDFVERHIRAGGLFDVIDDLRRRGVIVSTDLTFRALMLANDIAERRQSP
jgi:hypothetical protein